MAVNLNGFENTPREQREVLSREQFKKYIKLTENLYTEKIETYIIVEIAKRGKANFDSIYKENNITTREEFIALIKEASGIDITQDNPKMLLEGLPEDVLAQLENLDDLIDSIQNFDEFYTKTSYAINFNKIEELYADRLKSIATEVSKYDLSQIHSEDYAKAQFLRYINFQNTGAKLDFQYIKEHSSNAMEVFISTENLTGTEIISFDDYLYRRTKEEIVDNSSEWIYVEPKNFDISHYQTIIDSYNTSKSRANLAIPFLVNQELQDQNEWLIKYAFEEDLEKNLPLAETLWKQLTPESQIKYKNYFDKLVEHLVKTHDTYKINELLEHTIPEFIEDHSEDFKKIYTHQGNGRLNESFFRDVFIFFSDNFKENYYEENQNLSHRERALILSKTRTEYINQNFRQLFDDFFKSNADSYAIGPLYDSGEIINPFNQHEFDDSTMEYLLSISEKEIQNSKSKFEYIAKNIFGNLSPKNQIDYYQKFMQIGIDNSVSPQKVVSIFEKMNQNLREANYNDILAFSQTLSPEVFDYIRTTGYINMFLRMSQEKKETNYNDMLAFSQTLSSEAFNYLRGTGYIYMIQCMDQPQKEAFLEENIAEILLSLRTKYTSEDSIREDSMSPEQRKEFDLNYSKEFISILLEMDKRGDLNESNARVIIDNLPKLGKVVVDRLYKSNSEMIRTNASQLITAVSTLDKDEAISIIEDTERLFSKDSIPDFVKIYKFYENVVERKQGVLKNALRQASNYSPELQQAGSEKAGMRIIFSDLLNISLKSNNKSLRKFIDLLESGNETYVKYLNGGKNLDALTQDEKDTLRKYADTLYTIYDESLVSKHDIKRTGKKIKNSKDYTKTLEDLSKRYIGHTFPANLSNEVLNTIVGRMDELLAGKRTIEDFRTYMDRVNQASNQRHNELEKTKLVLEPGDLIKGVQNATSFLQSLFSNGIRAGEFLGVETHTDATPLDSDHSLILPQNIGDTLSQTISKTASSGYGSFFLVIKKDPEKLYFTRNNPEYTFRNESSPKYQSKLGKNADREAIKARISNRINGTFEEPKLEVFSSNVVGPSHYGVRTGMAITDVDYIVVTTYDKRIGYELAMNGTFIPVINRETNEVVFGMDDYKKIRQQMQGLAYYGSHNYIVDKTAYTPAVEEKVAQLFPDGDVKESISEKDARTKREAIERKVREALLEKLGLGFARRITGDVSPGFIEFIDTGSTGRGTNLPGDGDFDFSVKLDMDILDNPQRLEEFKGTLREVLAVRSNSPECSLAEFNGNFRYKKVQVEGVETPLDIDITFMQKAENVTYSTDMAVKERLELIKETDPEGYKRVIANIVLAKEMLKKEGIYKKHSSDGATVNGGFGGVGVENWILQNGGSFVKAMETFLEAAEESKSFNEFMEKYPIFDFGQNHVAKEYQHDSFIRGLSDSGFTKMQSIFKEFIKELRPQEISMAAISKNAIVNEEIRQSEFAEASQVIRRDMQELETDKTEQGGN